MATIYYIDSENVGDGWMKLLGDTDAKFIVFYTGHSPRIAYAQVIQLMSVNNKPEFVECYEGNNALDFQLVTYLGYQLYADNSSEMVIVSNDTGFDAVVLFWKARGRKVKRIPCSNVINPQPIEKKKPVSDKKTQSGLAAEAPTEEKICGVEKTELDTIINCIGVWNPSGIHLALINFYGNRDGESIYKCLKKEKFAAPAVQWAKETRINKFLGLIIRYKNTANISVPDSFFPFVVNNIVESKKTMANKVNATYGNLGPQLNKMCKPFYNTLAKIKKK